MVLYHSLTQRHVIKKNYYGNKFAFSFLSGTLSGEWKVIAIVISLQKLCCGYSSYRNASNEPNNTFQGENEKMHPFLVKQVSQKPTYLSYEYIFATYELLQCFISALILLDLYYL